MHAERTCPRCGGQLATGGGLDGLCPACLLASGEGSPGAAGAAALEEVRRNFPALEVEALIGRGGMGAVYRARQRRLDRTVALKVLVPELADDSAFAQRFLREARAMARMSHPNVVTVHDFGEEAGRYYLVMEYVEGASLRDVIAEGRLAPAQALAVVGEICAGLAYAHAQGVVHRDIKPENILIDRDGAAKIADFGLAKLAGSAGAGALTRTSQVMGTPQYMAPEQIVRPLEVDHRADIYSLGVVFYEMLTGELPQGVFPPPSKRAPIDVGLDEVVLKTLEREPERRYQAATDVRTDIERFAATGGAAVPPAAPAPGAPAAADQASAAHGPAGKLAEEADVGDSLAWLERMPGGGLVWGVLALALCWVWLILVGRVELGQMEEWTSVAYPFAFLALTAARVRLARGQRGVASVCLAVAAYASAIVVVVVLSSEPNFNAIAKAGEAVSALLLVVAHLFFDRWVRRNHLPSLAAGGGVFLIATIMHSSFYIDPGNQAGWYASGMAAVLCAASGLMVLPAYALRNVPRSVHLAVVRAFAVGLVAALVYFRGHL